MIRCQHLRVVGDVDFIHLMVLISDLSFHNNSVYSEGVSTTSRTDRTISDGFSSFPRFNVPNLTKLADIKVRSVLMLLRSFSSIASARRL